MQNSAGNVLKDKLRSDVLLAYKKEQLGEKGTLGKRYSRRLYLFVICVKYYLGINKWITKESADFAVKTLCAYTAAVTLMQINEEKYYLLLDGVLRSNKEIIRYP